MEQKYLTVTALTKYIKRKIEMDPHLNDVWLKGEISNFNHHRRGHMYLTIKDEHSRIQAVMFAGNNRHLKFVPENGMKVLIQGDLSVFEPYGQYQLYIRHMEPDGLGSLYMAFEQLKEKLHKQGYFSEQHKKCLPLFAKHIGVITSPTGAAVRDIITTIQRRFPIVNITVIPVLVQGKEAAQSIKRAIEYANKLNTFDVLIVGRGGGSIEDLWSFNEEIVAHAIFQSEIPIISAVGHETDFTISDYVADLRASTPTSAAEIAVPSQVECKNKITHIKQLLTKLVHNQIENNKNTLQQVQRSYAFRYPKLLINEKEQLLDQMNERLKRAVNSSLETKKEKINQTNIRLVNQRPQRRIEEANQQLSDMLKRHHYHISFILKKKKRELVTNIDKLSLLNPLEVMKRGFAIPYSQRGEILKSTKAINADELIDIKMTDGLVHCQVLDVRRDDDYGKE